MVSGQIQNQLVSTSVRTAPSIVAKRETSAPPWCGQCNLLGLIMIVRAGGREGFLREGPTGRSMMIDEWERLRRRWGYGAGRRSARPVIAQPTFTSMDLGLVSAILGRRTISMPSL